MTLWSNSLKFTCKRFRSLSIIFFFFNDTATTEIYTLSLHDALPICDGARGGDGAGAAHRQIQQGRLGQPDPRSEEHTSELQSQSNLVCRLLLEKKKKPHLSTEATGAA